MKIEVNKKESLVLNVLRRLFDKKLLKNKVYSMGLMLLGYLTVIVSGGDSTAFIFTLMMGLPIFFSDENCIL